MLREKKIGKIENNEELLKITRIVIFKGMKIPWKLYTNNIGSEKHIIKYVNTELLFEVYFRSIKCIEKTSNITALWNIIIIIGKDWL